MFLSYPILSYLILSYLILSYPILSYPILSYPTLPYPILSYPILSYPILSESMVKSSLRITGLNSLAANIIYLINSLAQFLRESICLKFLSQKSKAVSKRTTTNVLTHFFSEGRPSYIKILLKST